MNILVTLFLGSLLLGQLGGVSFFPGVVVYVHDVFLLFFLGTIAIRSLQKYPFTKPKLLWPIMGFVVVAVVSLLLNWSRFSPSELGFGSLYLVRWILYVG